MLLSKLLLDAGLDEQDLLSDPEVTGICPDSTRIGAGELFIAIEGTKKDGHQYLPQAICEGAAAAVVSKKAVLEGRIDPNISAVPIVVVEDTREASARLFAAWHGNPQKFLRIVGVTGTNGKTSVSRLIYEILTRAGKKCGLVGTTGCLSHREPLDIRSADPRANMTTPDPEELYRILAKMVEDGEEYAVMEVTSHALALSKTAPIDFEIAVFTNLTEDHLDFHGDMETYFEAKKRLFSNCGKAVINYDDKYGRRLAENIKVPVHLCSAEGRETDCAAEEIRLLGERGLEYKLVSYPLRLRVRSPLCGVFNVMNTMEAAVTCSCLGASASDMKESLAHFSGIEGRLEKLRLPPDTEFSVYLDYAHTPDALENLIRAARSFSGQSQRIVLLFGCGGERDRQKRPIMGKIATSMADHVIITSDNCRGEDPHRIISDVVAGAVDQASFIVIEDRREAIEYAVRNARKGDVILLAGKGHEEYEIDSRGKHPFSERALVREFVEKYI